MIYFVTKQQTLYQSSHYKMISEEESLEMIKDWKCAQADSETSGLDPYSNILLLFQLGSVDGEMQIVIDCTTVDIRLYKQRLEEMWLEFHNGKFDLQFLYSWGIVPRKVYDTMIVEQFLHLGESTDKGFYSLQETAMRRLEVFIDKSVRGEIIRRGITEDVILYAANDVKYLHQIMQKQSVEFWQKKCSIGAKLECDCVPAMAYLEWCGIKLDEDKWKAKMIKDKENLVKAKENLDAFVVKNNYTKFYHIDTQGDLWEGFNDNPIIDINWDSPAQVIKFAKDLGFDTTVQDKKTGKDKDSVIEKHLKSQVGINDEFLKLYFNYKEYAKVCSSFGQGHLDAINPVTHRLHASYFQIGTSTGRMSSGSDDDRGGINMQQLPKNEETRSCFVAEKGNLFCSCDYSAMEARLGAMVYNEKVLLDEFKYGSGDSHSAYAKVVYSKDLEGIEVKDIKKKRPDLRNAVKSIEFAVQFGSDGTAVAPQLKIPVEEARQLVTNLLSGMKGLKEFKRQSEIFVEQNGYVLIHPKTGHKAYWKGWEQHKQENAEFSAPGFWDEYRAKHKGTDDEVAQKVRRHFKEASKWKSRNSLNYPTQGGGAIVTKDAVTTLFNWIVDNGFFGKIKIVNVTHDEINSEFPASLRDSYPQLVEKIMQDSGAKYYDKLPLPAVAEVSDHWVH